MTPEIAPRRYLENSGAPEEPLAGGDVTEGVVKVGDTVRRPVSSASPGVRAVLAHLESVGFDGAPRYLGIDDQGRDVLTHVAGEVAVRPWPAWVATSAAATSVARLVRRYDDAMADADLTVSVGATGDPEGAPASIVGEPELIGHMDITPENVVFRNGRAAALIDFDLLRPAARAEEVSNLLLWWGAWMPPDDRWPVMREVDAARRGRAIVAAYGLSRTDRERLVDVARNAAERSWYSMERNARERGGGWRRMWDEGVGDRILRRQAWLAQNADELRAAVLSAGSEDQSSQSGGLPR